MKKFTSKITQLTATYSFAIPYFVMLIIFYTITHNDFFTLITGRDNKNYVAIAQTIAEGFTQTSSPYSFRQDSYFLGYPLLLAPFYYFISNLKLNPFILLPILNIIIGFLNCLIIEKIFGKKVAFFSIFFSLALIQRTCLGGAESFFMLTGLLSIYFYNRNVYLSIIFAGLAFWIRSFGIFFILGVFLTLALKKDVSFRFIYCLLLAMLMLGLYWLISLWFYGYGTYPGKGYNADWDHGTPFGIPFYHFIQEIYNEKRALSFSKNIAYLGLSLLPFYYIVKKMFQEKSISNFKIFDWIYMPYLFFIYQLNSHWGYVEFVRYTCPVIPIALFYFKAYLPESKIISYIILIVATFFAAYGFQGKLVGLAWDKII